MFAYILSSEWNYILSLLCITAVKSKVSTEDEARGLSFVHCIKNAKGVDASRHGHGRTSSPKPSAKQNYKTHDTHPTSYKTNPPKTTVHDPRFTCHGLASTNHNQLTQEQRTQPMASPKPLLLLATSFLSCGLLVAADYAPMTLTVVNNCPYPVWPGIQAMPDQLRARRPGGRRLLPPAALPQVLPGVGPPLIRLHLGAHGLRGRRRAAPLRHGRLRRGGSSAARRSRRWSR